MQSAHLGYNRYYISQKPAQSCRTIRFAVWLSRTTRYRAWTTRRSAAWPWRSCCSTATNCPPYRITVWGMFIQCSWYDYQWDDGWDEWCDFNAARISGQWWARYATWTCPGISSRCCRGPCERCARWADFHCTGSYANTLIYLAMAHNRYARADTYIWHATNFTFSSTVLCVMRFEVRFECCVIRALSLGCSKFECSIVWSNGLVFGSHA